MLSGLLQILLLVAIGSASIAVFAIVHHVLNRLCLAHARSFCRRHKLRIRDCQWGPAFNAHGKTEYTLVDLDCTDVHGRVRQVRLLVWIFGVRKILRRERDIAPGEAPQHLPQTALTDRIPYNPGVAMIGVFFAFSILLVAAGVLMPNRAWIAVVLAVVCMALSLLLVLRRYAWPRHLIVNEDSIAIPTEFLKLRPFTARYQDISKIYLARIGFTSVLRVRTNQNPSKYPTYICLMRPHYPNCGNI